MVRFGMGSAIIIYFYNLPLSNLWFVFPLYLWSLSWYPIIVWYTYFFKGGPLTIGTIYIGTSGFSYREGLGSFYPRGLKGLEMLSYYAANFNTVELNNTFYQLPFPDTLNAWKDSTGAGFRFAVKAGQRITHRKDFGIPDGYFELFLSRIAMLHERLGPVLFQFPPAQGNPQQITGFIHQLRTVAPANLPLIPVIELRNRKLFNEGFFQTLRGCHVNLCFNDGYLEARDWPQPWDAVYLRLRNGPYTMDYLKKTALLLRQWESQGRGLLCLF